MFIKCFAKCSEEKGGKEKKEITLLYLHHFQGRRQGAERQEEGKRKGGGRGFSFRALSHKKGLKAGRTHAC